MKYKLIQPFNSTTLIMILPRNGGLQFSSYIATIEKEPQGFFSPPWIPLEIIISRMFNHRPSRILSTNLPPGATRWRFNLPLLQNRDVLWTTWTRTSQNNTWNESYKRRLLLHLFEMFQTDSTVNFQYIFWTVIKAWLDFFLLHSFIFATGWNVIDTF